MSRLDTLRIVVVVALLITTTGGIAMAATENKSVDDPERLDPEDVCQRVDNSDRILVGVLPGPDTGLLTGQTSLYPGSRLQLVLCRGNRPIEGWSLEDHPGYDEIAATESMTTVEITGREYPVPFRQLLQERSDIRGVVISSPPSASYQPALMGSESQSIRFENQERMESFATSEQSFVEAEANLESNLTALNETTNELADGEPLSTDRDGRIRDEILPGIAQSTSRLEESGSSLRNSGYELVAAGQSPRTATEVIERSENREERINSRTKSGIQEYLRVLDARADAAKNTILMNIGLALVAGIVVGVGLGAVYPYHRAQQYEGKARLTSSAEYGTRIAILPAVLGLILVALTVVVVFLLGGENIIGVIL